MARKVALLVLALWFGAGIVVGGVLMLRHAALRVPDRSDRKLEGAIAALVPRAWSAVHVLYRECPCSTKTIAHLLARKAMPQLTEVVLVVDDARREGPQDAPLRAAGYRVVVVSPEQLRTQYGLEAVPVFVVARPDGALAYVGGYSRHQSTRFADVAIVTDVMRAAEVTTLPVFGCPTSKRLATAMDPLGLDRRPGAR